MDYAFNLKRIGEAAMEQQTRKPLNGTKTHPLTAHAMAELRDLSNKPCPRQAVNPGVSDRLLREDLVEVVMLPSPFKTHGGKLLDHMRITDAGRRAAGMPPNSLLSDKPSES